MQQRASLEIKVGAFIVTGVVLLVLFLFAIGDVATYFQPGYGLRIIFDSAIGLSDGSPVQYAGVEVGKVTQVQIVTPRDGSTPKVEVDIRLPKRIQIRTDDEAAISTFGLLGEKYLEIRPGPQAGTILHTGGMLIGKPPVSTERIIERSNEVLAEFKRTLEGLNSLVGDPEARIYIKEAVQEARDATRNWRLFGERLNLAMSYAESGQGNLGKLLYDDELYHRVMLFLDDLQQHPWKLLGRPSKKKQSAASPPSPESSSSP